MKNQESYEKLALLNIEKLENYLNEIGKKLVSIDFKKDFVYEINYSQSEKLKCKFIANI